MSGGRRDAHYITVNSGHKLYGRYWYPEERPRGLVFISHGFSEHTGNYEELGQALANDGFLAFGHDHVGHGLSEGKRATVDSLETLVNHVFEHVVELKSLYRSVPCFLFGHSMGGLVAIRVVQRNPSFFRGMVLEGPLVELADPPSYVVEKAAEYLNKLVPDLQYTRLDLDKVTSDEATRDCLASDPLRWHGGVKISMGVALVRALKDANENLVRVMTPFLILHAEADALCMIGGSRSLHNVASTTDKQLITYPQPSEHNLLCEVPQVRAQALNDILTWIKLRCPL